MGQPDQLTPWVWCVLAFTLLFGSIFSFLAWDVSGQKPQPVPSPLTASKQATARRTLSRVPVLQVFLDFRRVVRDPHFTAMAGNDKHAWWVITHKRVQAALFAARQCPSSSCCTCRAQLFMGAAGSAFFAGAPPGTYHAGHCPAAA